MKKRLLVLMVWLGVLLSACAPRAESALPTAQTGGVSQPNAQATQPGKQPGCTVVQRQPTPGPTQNAIIPPPGEKDWAHGPQDAYVTVIEYGDFQ